MRYAIIAAIAISAPSPSHHQVGMCCLGEVQVPAGKVTFHCHLPDRQGPRQVVY